MLHARDLLRSEGRVRGRGAHPQCSDRPLHTSRICFVASVSLRSRFCSDVSCRCDDECFDDERCDDERSEDECFRFRSIAARARDKPERSSLQQDPRNS